MSIKYKNGDKYSMLTLLEFSNRKNGTNYWLCKCDCGKEKSISVYDVFSGHTSSCGCMSRKWIKDRQTVHGLTETREYKMWCHMISRCTSKTNKKYSYYGGRGITIHKPWLEKNGIGFMNFLKDMGKSPLNYSLDRIDVNGNYEPSNCRWASDITQGQNRRNVKSVILNGIEMPRVEAERILGIGYLSINNRKNKTGCSLQEATDHFANKKKEENFPKVQIEINDYLLSQLSMAA